jgi:hypothetical protein
MKAFGVLSILFYVASNVSAQVYSGKTGALVTTTWLETGFTRVGDEKWVSISTFGVDFVNPIVLISLPEIPGNNYTEGRPTAQRIRNIVVNSGRVTFQTKMYIPNDTFCSTEWRKETRLDPVQVAWMVVEQGVYIVNGSKFIVSTGQLTRTNPPI